VIADALGSAMRHAAVNTTASNVDTCERAMLLLIAQAEPSGTLRLDDGDLQSSMPL
jgi:hypothetical protein